MMANISLLKLPGQFNMLSTTDKVRMVAVGAFASYACTSGAYYVYKRITNRYKRLEKKRENAASIEQLSQRLRDDPISDALVAHITGLTLEELCGQLKDGKIRPIVALKAYQTKALEAHRKTNCLVEVITEAEELALELEKGPKHGDLWGVPVSIKDDLGIKGYDSTIGMVIRIGKTGQEDSSVVKALRRGGAIPFVKTNVPQTEMTFEPGNPINGVVHNPHKHGYGPGGSSSGEGALIASGGSILGVGSDIGGSIRVPSHFCGIYGFKPTSERISTRGIGFDCELVIPIRGVWGPMSRDVHSLVTMMKLLWKGGEMSKSDPECVPLPFDDKEFSSGRKLRVGYYVDNGVFPTFSACVRAVDMAKDVFAKEGHELVPWSPPNPDHIMEMLFRVFNADGGESMGEKLKYDIIDPTMKHTTSLMYTPHWIKKILAALIYPLNPKIAMAIRISCGTGSVAKSYEMIYDLWQTRRAIQDSWNEAGLDVVLCPPQVGAAPPLGSSDYLLHTALYTATYNLLHFPAGVVPVTKVQQRDLDQLDSNFPPVDKLHRTAREAMSKTLNLPIGVMVASARYKDELCLRAMRVLEEGLGHTIELV